MASTTRESVVSPGAGPALGIQLAVLLVRSAAPVCAAVYLTPAEFGLYALILALFLVSTVWLDSIVPSLTMQLGETSSDDQTLQSISAIVGAGGALLTAFLIQAQTFFLMSPDATRVSLLLGIGTALSAVGVVPITVLARQRRLLACAVVELCSQIASVAVSLVLLDHGLGPIALAWGYVAAALSRFLLCWIMGCRVRCGTLSIGRAKSLQTRLVGAGAFYYSNFASRTLDVVVLGFVSGESAAGIYRVALLAVSQPNQLMTPIRAIGLPLARHHRHDAEACRQVLVASLVIANWIAVPSTIAVGFLGPIVVDLAFGSQWSGAIPVIYALLPAAVLQPTYSMVGFASIARDRPDLLARFARVVPPVLISGFLIGSMWGALGMALIYSICITLIAAPYSSRLTMAATGLTMTPIVRSILAPAVPGLLAGGCASMVQRGAGDDWMGVVWFVVVFVSSLALSLAIWRTGRTELQGSVKTLLQRRPNE